MSDLPARLARLSPGRQALLFERLVKQGSFGDAPAPIPRAPRAAEFPLSFAQRRLWLFEQLVPGTATYHVCQAFRLRGPLDLARLEDALGGLVARHGSLRTTFHASDGEPLQRVRAAHVVPLVRRDLASGGASATDSAILDAVRHEITAPFDLSASPPVRALALRIGPDDHVFVLTLHHLLTDGWSLAVLNRDLAEFYNAALEGREPRLPSLPIEYVDFVHWEQEETRRPSGQAHVRYWAERLSGAPPLLGFPIDRPRTALTSAAAHQVDFAVPASLGARLDEFCRTARVTTFVALTSTWAALLRRYGCGDDLMVGTPFAGRSRAETADVLGCFVNVLGLRLDLSGDPAFEDLVQRVSRTGVEAMEHQAAPFEAILEQAPRQRSLAQTPVFQTVVAYLSLRTDQLPLRDLQVEPHDLPATGAHFDTTLSINQTATGLRGNLTLRSDLFDPSTCTRLVEHFLALLGAAVDNPGVPVSRLPLLSDRERQLVVHDWNRTERAYPECTVRSLFERAALRVPDRIALVEGDRRLTYRELDELAERIAAALEEAGVRPGELVGVRCGRSMTLVAAMLGVLKAGGAYVPLDVDEPAERLAGMLEDVKPTAILLPAAVAGDLRDVGPRVLTLEGALSHAVRTPPPRDVGTPDDLAYVMFTSGSSGKPKAVAIPHRGIARLLFGVDYAAFGQDETFLHMAAPTFDASTFEVWGALLHGGTCVVLPQRKPTIAEIAGAIRTHHVTTAWFTTSLFNMVIDDAPESLRPLRQLLVGGEALSVEHVARAASLLPATQLVNGYGPTESTTFACCYRIPATFGHSRAAIPIGRPIANTEAYVLDEHLAPTPVGVPGDLYLGGAGLARGYLQAPELTAERFVAHPFRVGPGARLYRTGDLARWLPDGTLEYCGRRDQQVKIRGFRVELGEIAAVLSQHPGVAQAVASVHELQPGSKVVVAFVVPRAGVTLEPSAVLDFARARLPDYMVPSRVVVLASLPLTAHGKVDRGALHVPDDEGRAGVPIGRAASDLETTLLDIWRDVLQAPALGPRDDFFEWGGNSLVAIRLLLRVDRALGRRLPVAALFEASTVQQFAALVQEGAPVGAVQGPSPPGP